MDGCAPAVRVYRSRERSFWLDSWVGGVKKASGKQQEFRLDCSSVSLNEAFHTAVSSGRLASWDLVFQGWGWKLVTLRNSPQKGVLKPRCWGDHQDHVSQKRAKALLRRSSAFQSVARKPPRRKLDESSLLVLFFKSTVCMQQVDQVRRAEGLPG